MKRSLLLGLLIGVGLILIWGYYFDFENLVNNIKELNYFYLIFSLAFYIMAYFVRSYRWNRLLKTIKKFSVWQTYIWSLAGNFVNYLIPIRAGEVAKAVIVKKTTNTSISLILPSIFIDKFFDTVGIFVILLMMPFLDIEIVPVLQWLIGMLIFVFIIGMFVLLYAVIAEEKLKTMLKKFFSFIPNKIEDKVFSVIELFVEGTAMFKHNGRTIFEVIGLTVVGVLLDGLYFYFMFRAFGFADVSLVLIFFGYTLLNLSYILPQPPAQLGSNEWLMSIIFVSGIGMLQAQANSLILVAHILTGIIVTVMGIMSLSMVGMKIVECFTTDEKLNK